MIDIVFAIIILFAIIKGYQKGLIIAVFSIIALVIGLAAAVKLSAVVAVYLQHNISVSSKIIPFISFAFVFLVVVFLVHLGGKLIQKTFEMALLGWANRLGGIVLYAFLYTIIFSVLLFYGDKIKLLDRATKSSSIIYPVITPLAPEIINGIGSVIPIFKDAFTQLEGFFSGVSNKID